MANEYETPAEREAKINETSARINEAIAQDTALGMAEKAEQERERASLYATGNTRLSNELDSTRSQRNLAEREASAARGEARNIALGFYLFAGIIAAALIFGFFVMTRGDETSATTSAELPPIIVTKTVVAPTPAPTVAPAPTVVHEYVPVPVPVAPAPVPEPTPLHGYTEPARRMPPKPAPTAAPTMVTPDSQNGNSNNQPLRGYVEP